MNLSIKVLNGVRYSNSFKRVASIRIVRRCLSSKPSSENEYSKLSDVKIDPASTNETSKSAKTEGLASSTPSDRSKGFKGPMTWATLALACVLGTGVVVYYNYARDKKIEAQSKKSETFGKALLGGPWELVNSDGKPMSDKDLLGQYYLIYFGFTFCPDICPNELVKMSRAIDLLAKRKSLPTVLPVFITLDPHRDTCEQVGAYVKSFHPKMLGLTGTSAQVANVAKAFRVYFQETEHQEGDNDYLVDHSVVMYLMSPEGEFVDFYTQKLTANELADKISTQLKSKLKESSSSSGGIFSFITGK
jgi:protein SCO1